MKKPWGAERFALLFWLGLAIGPLVPAWAEEPAAARAPGVAENLILLGQSLPLSGPAGEQGREFRRGAALYFDQVNTSGGVHGRNIFLISRDDAGEAARAAENARRLLEKDRVFALFGVGGVQTAQAVLPVAEEHHAPLIAPRSGAEGLRTPFNPLVYNVRAGDDREADALLARIASQGLGSVALVHQDDEQGQTGFKTLQQALERARRTAAAVGLIAKGDVNHALNGIKSAQPEAVILIAAPATAAEFIRRAKAAGLESEFFALSTINSKALAADLWLDGLGVTVSQAVPFPGDATVPVVAEYMAALRLATPEATVSYPSLEGFIAAKALVLGLESAGPQLDRQRLMQALDALGEQDLGGFRLNWSPVAHAGSEFVGFTVVGEQGRWLY